MKDLPAQVMHAIELNLDDVERQLRELTLEAIAAEEDLDWSFDLGDGWRMFVEVNNDTQVLGPDSLLLDLQVSAGRWLARPRMRRQVRLERPAT